MIKSKNKKIRDEGIFKVISKEIMLEWTAWESGASISLICRLVPFLLGSPLGQSAGFLV